VLHQSLHKNGCLLQKKGAFAKETHFLYHQSLHGLCFISLYTKMGLFCKRKEPLQKRPIFCIISLDADCASSVFTQKWVSFAKERSLCKRDPFLVSSVFTRIVLHQSLHKNGSLLQKKGAFAKETHFLYHQSLRGLCFISLYTKMGVFCKRKEPLQKRPIFCIISLYADCVGVQRRTSSGKHPRTTWMCGNVSLRESASLENHFSEKVRYVGMLHDRGAPRKSARDSCIYIYISVAVRRLPSFAKETRFLTY